MKIFSFLIFLVFLCFCSMYAQTSNSDTTFNGDTYSKVFESKIPLKTKFLNAKEWVAKTYGDYKSVLQFEDEANGKLIIKGRSSLGKEVPTEETHVKLENETFMNYTLTIDCKDLKFRIKLEDLNFTKVQELSILGRTTISDKILTYAEFTDNTYKSEAMWQYDYCKKELQELIKTDTTSMKKKELKKYHERLDYDKYIVELFEKEMEQKKLDANELKHKIKGAINSLVSRAAKAIDTNDDF